MWSCSAAPERRPGGCAASFPAEPAVPQMPDGPAMDGPRPERVCDYPRPPALVPSEQHILVRALDTVLAETRRSLRVLETYHPPTYYLPPEAMRQELLRPAGGRSFCEWKGVARYWDVVVGERRLPAVVWS